MAMILNNEMGRLEPYGANVPSTGQIPMHDTATDKPSSVTAAEIVAGASGVTGPASATDTGTVIFNGTTGKIVQDSGIYPTKTVVTTTDVTNSTNTLANVTGLSVTVVPGTYKFRCVLPGTADGTSGIKYAFNYTTTSLTSLEATGIGNTSAAVATQHTTTTTTQTALFDQAAVVLMTQIMGSMVVGTGGTVDLQMCTHTGTTTATTYKGAFMEFTRIS